MKFGEKSDNAKFGAAQAMSEFAPRRAFPIGGKWISNW